MAVSTKTAVALLACGSFNPPTYAHLRMFERARDYLEKTLQCKVCDGIISPVGDAYAKKELVNARHRVKMVQLSVESSDWIRCDTWESSQKQWSRSLLVLRHVQNQLKEKYSLGRNPNNSSANGNNEPTSSKKRRSSDFVNDMNNVQQVPKLMLLCGADLLESFAVPNLWQKEDIEEIVRDYGLVVICRNDSDPYKFVYEHDIMSKFEKNIHIVREWITNDISSTKIRRALQRNDSVRYLIPDKVLQYIKENKLYADFSGDANANPNDTAPPTSNLHNFESYYDKEIKVDSSYGDFSDYDNVPKQQLYRLPQNSYNNHHKQYNETIYNDTSQLYTGTKNNDTSLSDSRTYMTTAPPSSVTLASFQQNENGHQNCFPPEDEGHQSLINSYQRNTKPILRKPRPVSYHQDLSRELVSDKRENGYVVKCCGHSMNNISSLAAATNPSPEPVQRFEEIAWEYDPEKTKSLPNLKVKWLSPKNIMHQQRFPSIANMVVKVKQLRLTITPETTV